ncbi:MAG: DUF4405 domain-containing protein [Luteolibacter sp.]
MDQPASQPAKPAKPDAKRDGLRKWIPRIGNLLLWLLFCIMSGTGLLLAYRLPPGSRGGHGLSALGWTRHDWGDLHQWISFAFLAMVFVHMVLHWRWFWQVACRKRAWPLLAGIVAGLVLLVGILCLPVKRKADDARAHVDKPHSEQREGAGERLRYRGGRE